MMLVWGYLAIGLLLAAGTWANHQRPAEKETYAGRAYEGLGGAYVALFITFAWPIVILWDIKSLMGRE